MHAFFWGAGMVTSMVPRDIEPVTPLECFVTTITMFVGLLLNAFVISSLTTALATMNSKKELAGKQLDTIRNYLILKGVPTDLRSRILEYYEYLFTSSQSLASSVKMDEMPPNLSAQLVIAMYRKLAAKCTLMKEVSEPCLITLMQGLVPCVFVPGQLLVFEGHSLHAVYFINRGHIQLLERTVHVALLRDHDNFGIDDFMLGYTTNKPAIVRCTAKSITYCDVMTLSEEQLREAVDRCAIDPMPPHSLPLSPTLPLFSPRSLTVSLTSAATSISIRSDEKFQSHIKMGTYGQDRGRATTRRGHYLRQHRASSGGKQLEKEAGAVSAGDDSVHGNEDEGGGVLAAASPELPPPPSALVGQTSSSDLAKEASKGSVRAQAALMA